MSKVKNILLLGAGFSRNWGGWLASEVFEYLLGCDQIDERAKKALWTHRSVGGFEAALAELQGTYRHRPDNRTEQSIENLQRATLQMFDDMNASFQATTFSYELHYFLDTFDSIFTLNQDLLMERCYLNRRHIIATHYVPGVELVDNQDKRDCRVPLDGLLRPSQNFSLIQNQKPYFKLHGSCNWRDNNNGHFLVMGGYKEKSIKEHALLSWYHKEFRKSLLAGVRLMVIGYSFGDEHINRVIAEAAGTGLFKLFIIDPNGIDAVRRDMDRTAAIPSESELFKQLKPCLVGGSRRSLLETFGNGTAECRKVMRFFE